MLSVALLSGCTYPRPKNENIWSNDNVLVDFSYLKNKKEVDVLLLSGGGANGAWGAGVINGLYDSGNLKQYDIVTGVSTGSLIATAAFIGNKDYNDMLKRGYTDIAPDDILDIRYLRLLILNNSLSSNKDLYDLIYRCVTDDIIDIVAKEALKGRKLYVGCTNLDKNEFKLWDMTEIALKKDYELYRQVLLASCSLPGLYPPVFIGGNMYVDGGVSGQVAIPGDIFKFSKKINMYIIYNGVPNAIGRQEVKNNIKDILIRSVWIMHDKNNTHEILYIQEKTMNLHGSKFYFNCVGNGAKLVGFSFTKEELKNLYNAGYKDGLTNFWKSSVFGDK